MTRLNKFISETGICSRREADRLIEAGKVSVNGKVAELGTKVTDEDDIKINGNPLKNKSKVVYIALNKPAGITCTTDRSQRDNIIDFLKYPERVFPVGRLDKPSQGLIFLTNDGDIVNKILRAGNNHEKEYHVTVDKTITQAFISAMSNGVEILDTVTKKCFVEQTGPNSFRIILVQGLNRQIRRMCDVLGYHVTQLIRTRIMNVTLDGIKEGKWRYLTQLEMDFINNAISGSIKTEEASH
jgi:23S rRNA pseudouridine2604 synthase